MFNWFKSTAPEIKAGDARVVKRESANGDVEYIVQKVIYLPSLGFAPDILKWDYCASIAEADVERVTQFIKENGTYSVTTIL